LDPKPDPQSGEPVATPNNSLSLWFRQNFTKLLILGAVIFVVCRFFYPLDVLIAGLGLSLIIFIHELGHFLAAKFCDVHVKTFSIGFGPPLPFCSFKRGETTYKLGMIPLGGFVAMIGEGDARTPHDADGTGVIEGDTVDAEPEPGTPESDPGYPRSFKNKTVPQRMLIISAGVIMNIILAATAFVAAYLHGVEEQPAIVQSVDPGSAAWKAGIRPGAQITKLNSHEKPWFDDIKPSVTATRKGETVDLAYDYKGVQESLAIEPLKMDGSMYPVLGIAPPQSMTLMNTRRDSVPPFDPGSAAATAQALDGSGFLPGDRIVAMSDPRKGKGVTPLEADRDGMPGLQFDFRRRLVQLAGQKIEIHVLRKGQPDTAEPTALTLPPVYRKDTGLRMKMGPIAALRTNSPAAKAGLKSRDADGDAEREPGDVLSAVQVIEPGGKRLRFSTDPKETSADANTTVALLDPLKLPLELNSWADRQSGEPNPNRTVSITVQRFIDHRPQAVTFDLPWDPEYREDFSALSLPGSPVPLGGLGIAYRVSAEVNVVKPDSAASAAGLQPGDVITQVRFHTKAADGKTGLGNWDDVERDPKAEADKPKLLRWAFVDYKMQTQGPHTFDVKIHRDGQEHIVGNISAKDDAAWPVPAEGWYFGKELRTQKAEGVGEALQMGFHRTKRAIQSIYQGLYGMIVGRISVKVMSGPITLARASYILAGEDSWKLLLLLGLISVNLAVVNFLPIPVLDGGHMMFLLYEGVRRKPAPESVQVILTWVGLAMVLGLMLFTIGLDIWRLLV
jgi:regulator of sigma E protease